MSVRLPARAPGRRLREVGLAAAVVFAALAARVPFLPFESADYRLAVSHWYEFIVANGYFDSWQYDFAHYSPPYLYLLTAAAWLFPSAPALTVVKTISIAGDFVLALFAYGCVRLRFRESRVLPLLAAGAVLLAPTVVLNSARWGQVDALYTAFLMACLYALLAGREKWAGAAFGLAFAVKAQAVFLAPLLYYLWARKSLSGAALALVPAVFVLTLVPAALAGRPALDLLTVYGGHAGFYSELTAGAPNLYQWISNDHYRWWPLGVLLTAALVHGVRRLLDRRRPEMTRETVVFLALFSVLLTPFFLPKMHDRFFFPADVFAIVLAFYRPHLWFVPVAVGAASFAAYANFLFAYPDAPLGWAAALLLVVLADLTRRLLVGFGWRPDFRAALQHLWRRARAGWAAAAPAFALLLALAALFAGFAGDGRLGRPLANDGESAGTLARASARFADSGLFAAPSEAPIPLGERPGRGRPADRTATSGEGREPRGIVPGGSVFGEFALGAALRHFGDDLSAQVAAARALMLLLYGGAALFAYLSLRRILSSGWPARRDSNRWIALAATLLAFGSAAAGADTVAVGGAPAAFGVFLLFHGMVVFLEEGRFAPLLAKGGAALLLGWSAYGLLASFVLLGLLGEWRRRRLAAARAGESGTAPVFGPLPEGSLRGPIGSPFLALGLFGLVLGLAAASSGAVGGTVSRSPAERLGDRGSASAGETLRPGFRRIARGFVPHAVSGGVFSMADGTGERGGVAAAAGALVAAAGLAFAAFARSLPLLALGLGGLVSALWFGGGGPPETGSMSALGISLVGFTGLGLALRRAFGRRGRGAWAGVAVAAGAAAVVWGLSFLPPGVEPGGGEARAAERAATDHLREDFGRIRRALSRRTERTVFLAPLRVGGGTVAGARAEFLLGDGVLITDPARRSSAEFVVSGEAESGGGRAEALLTPGNEVAFLHHRAAYDGALDDWIAEAGAPRARSEFRIHLGGGRLLFVKEGCAAENTEGIFLVHLVPEDPDDLPPRRKAYGFENRSFRFSERVFERGERCVAGVRFPEYPIRSVIVGRSFRNPDATYETIWREEFAPNGAAGPSSNEVAAEPPPRRSG